MKSTAITGNTIRFRRWSRKAYAAFASIGRCVTIGCLRKSVADSSLSKQKKTGTAGHAGCGEESTWKGITHSRQTDIGIPSGSEAALVNGIMEPGTNLQVLFREPVTCAYANTGKQETYISETKNRTGTDCRNHAAHTMRRMDSGNPCLLYIQPFYNKRI